MKSKRRLFSGNFEQDRGHHVKTPWRDISQTPGLGHIWAEFFFFQNWAQTGTKIKKRVLIQIPHHQII